MKNLLLITVILAYIAFSIQSCKGKESVPEPVAGKGGNTILKVTAKHHGKVIDSITVYIKYNTQDAATIYDDSVIAIPDGGIIKATFTNLKKGKYYLYGYGYDHSILSPVKGGIPYTVTEEKTIDLTLPVTETH
jgi:hypothetical protein